MISYTYITEKLLDNPDALAIAIGHVMQAVLAESDDGQ